jgi:hypothetical protein
MSEDLARIRRLGGRGGYARLGRGGWIPVALRPGAWWIVGALLLAACGSPSASSGKLFINEVLPANKNSCADEVGERNDWIELYNGGDQEVDLEGFSLTDDSASPDKARLGKGVTIKANAVRMFWVDGTPDQGSTHLTFKLKSKGEGILLYDREQRLVDQFRWTDALDDVSFARLPDGSGEFARCATPTCGEKNGSSCAP